MAQMETHVVRDVTGKSFDINVLKKLDYLFKQYVDIRETNYLQDFDMLETLETFNPKFIIRDVQKIYMRNIVDIYHQPDRLQNFIFTFHEEDKDVCTFTFSNNMIFKDDITIICFLYHISTICEYDQCETVQILKSLMFNKYGICMERKADNTEPTQKQKEITLIDTVLSFPSITWSMVNDLELWAKNLTRFSDFDLPKITFTPRILPLLPRLKEQPPLAILMVIVLRLYKWKNLEMYEKLSLQDIRNCIESNLSYGHKLFPERLKLELCKKWKIIILEKGIYKYNSNFETHRQKAKDIIAEMKPDDSNLEHILSEI